MSKTIDYKTFFTEENTPIQKYWGDHASGCIFIAKDTGKILLLRRSDNVDFEPGYWGCLGGKVDAGETAKEAVKREIEEESGYTGELKISHLYTYRDGDFKYENYLVIIPFEFIPQLNWEHDTSAWVEFGEWPNPLHFGIVELLKHDGNKIKKVVDLIKKKQDNIFEMDAPPAIINHVDKSDDKNIINKNNSDAAYIVIATVWGEARGEGKTGMQAVLNVIMNRAHGNFNKAAHITLEPNQFSTWNGIKDPLEKSLKLAEFQRKGTYGRNDHKSYVEAIELVDAAMAGHLPDITDGATFYYNPKTAHPSWAKHMIKTKSIGHHDFYKLPEKSVENEDITESDVGDIEIINQGLVDDGIYGYELKSSNSRLRYGFEPTRKIFYLYNISTTSEGDRNKGYAKKLLEYFFSLIKQNKGSLEVDTYTTSGNLYIKHVVDRLAKQYNVRLI